MNQKNLLAILVTAFLAISWISHAQARSNFWSGPPDGSTACATCHGSTTTCAGCHAHGVHPGSAKNSMNVVATPDKANYSPGETVTVSVTGGYRAGWSRGKLWDKDCSAIGCLSDGAVAVASNICPSCPVGVGGDDGITSSFPGPIVLTFPAPANAGSYTWSASWYGNDFDMGRIGGSTTFGPIWLMDPGNADHGDEIVTFSFDVVIANSAPVAVDDLPGGVPIASTPANTSVDLDVLANDTDVDVGDTITINTYDFSSANLGSVSCSTSATSPTPQCTYTPAVNACGADTFTYDVTDGDLISLTRAVVTIQVGDANAPVVTPPVADLTITLPAGSSGPVPATDPAIAAWLASATANDPEEGSVAVTNNAPGGFPIGTTPVTFTATDGCLNEGTATANVIINVADNELPVVTAPAAPLSVTAPLCATSVPGSDTQIQNWLALATADDFEDGPLSVSNDAPLDFLFGTTTVTFSAVDSLGGTGSATSTVTAIETPNTAPVVTPPAPLTLDVPAGTTSVPATDPAIAAFLAGASATDTQDGSLAVTNNAPADFLLGSTQVTFSATDACGLTDTASATVTIQELGGNTVPTLLVPAPISLTVGLCASTVPATDPAIAAFLAGATADDVEDGDISGLITNDAPTDFPAAMTPGTITTVNFSVTDSGDPTGTPATASSSSTVTLIDPNTAPGITAPAPLTITAPLGDTSVPATDPAIAAFLAGASGSDVEDGALAPSNDAPIDFPLGTTTVTFSVIDSCGQIATATSTVTVLADTNEAPTANAGGPYTGTVGTAVILDGTLSFDSDGTIVSYAWNFGDGNTGTGVSPSHTYATDGTFTVSLTVTDNDGATDSATATATIAPLPNVAPTADAGGPYSGLTGFPVSFDGTASSDSDGTIVSYSWDFGDGNTGTGATPTHAYASDGTFNVILTVTDNDGATDLASATATIILDSNAPPTADAGGPYTAEPGVTISFNGSGSSDPDSSLLMYNWDFGDGAIGIGPFPKHAYAAEGTYTVTLVVSDLDGGTSAPATTTATIAVVINVPPTANAGGPYNGETGAPLSFDGSASSDSDGTITSYSWDFGDGNTGTGVTPIHTYATDSTFTVSLTVTDNSGATDTTTTTATIVIGTNTPPTADAGGPYTGLEGSPVSFNGLASFDSDGSIASYSWDFGDGNTATGATPSHTYAVDGTFTVTLTVTDNEGATGTATATATITPLPNVAPTANAGGPYSGVMGTAVSLDGSASSDSDGTIASYSWDFGDGSTGTGVTPSHTYVASGLYTVTLTVTDNDGGTDTASTTANISTDSNIPPTADTGGPYTAEPGVTVSFNGSGSSDPDSSLLMYSWDFGDGAVGFGPFPKHAYAAEGTYTVSLVVSDLDGGVSAPATTTATIAVVINVPPTANAGGPYNGETGAPLSFDGTASSDSDGTITSYAWDFGDGNTGTGVTPIHTYATDSVFTVSLTVTDNSGATDTTTTTATIVIGTNTPPTANAGGPYTGLEGSPVSFNGGASFDSDGTIASYSWDFGDGNTATGATPSHTYAVDGTFTVTLTVTDNEGATGTATATATITPLPNVAPTANAGGPYSGVINTAVNFNGTASSDSDGTIVSYNWDFGDGSTGTGVTPSHTYVASGLYTVTLTVTDNDGGTDTATASANISVDSNIPPTADAGGPYTAEPGVTISFNGSGSSDPDSSLLMYNWDFGDGATGFGPFPKHAYAAEGTYTVTLIVSDLNGGTSAPATTTATIAIGGGNVPPTANAGGPYTGTAGTAVNLDGSASSDSDGTIASYSWDFGDGNTSTGVNPSHTYIVDGTFTVTLTVTDNDGATNTATTTATIAPALNIPPTANAGGPYTGTAGTAVSFDGSASSDSDGTIASYAWTFGDGNTGTGATPSHTYATDGTFTVMLTVTDNDGATDTTTTTATIAAIPNVPPTADAGGPYTGTVGNVVSFDGRASSDSDGTILSYSWDYGDGNTGVGAQSLYAYAAEGTFTVTLTVTDNDGATDTATTTATITPAPNVAPTADAGGPYTGTAGTAISLDGSASSDTDGTIVSYAWDFGDGNSGTGVSPSHTYATDGTFTVVLTVTDNDGANDTTATTATIGPIPNVPPTANAGGPYNGTVGVALSLDGTVSTDSDGTIVSYAWDFGDGNTGTGVTPSHTYATVGTYTVSLTVTDNDGATDTATTSANITAVPNVPPTANAGGPYTGTVGIAVSFNGTASTDSDGTIASYAWNFGDGNTGVGPTPSHTYATDGTYTVSLTVIDNDGATDTASATATIAPVPNVPPTANAGGPYTGTVGIAVSFNGTASTDSDGTIVSYAWNFGDGNTGTGATPSHTYATDGTFTVSLTVTDNDGATDTATATATIAPVPNVPPTADAGGPYNDIVGAVISLNGTASTDSDGTIVSYAWDFGDGNTGTGATPTHTYLSVGTYTVSLTVTDNDGATDTATTSASITAVPNVSPTADAGGPYTGTVGIALSLNGTASTDSDGTIVSYAWDFGDGNTGTGATPSHTYATDGTFTVSLTVTDNDGATDTATATATIAPVPNVPPTANAGGPYNDTVGAVISLNGTASTDSDGTIVSYAWDFGDGNTGTGATPSHTYATDGSFTVSLTVTDNDGATDTATATATIAPANIPPTADAGGPYTGTAGTAIGFNGTASTDSDGTIVSYAWDFGDGNTGTGATPMHTYVSAGTYTVSLTVTDDGGATDTATATATISAVPNVPPTAVAGGPYTGTVGTAVNFDGTLSFDTDGSIASYSWDFGDGNTGTGATPSHTYATDGTFTVSLTVTDNDGATDTASATATIAPVGLIPPVADAGGAYAETIGIALTLDGSASIDPDGTIVSYSWDFGDGNTASGVSPSHTYAAVGSYTVTLTVTDNDGLTDTATTTAIISDVNGARLYADHCASCHRDHGGGSTSKKAGRTYTDIADAIANQNKMLSLSFLTVAEVQAITDFLATDGNSGAPIANAGGPYTGMFGNLVFFDGSASIDNGGTIVSYNWNFGEGGTGTGATTSYAFAQAGTYTVALTATDDSGLSDTATSTIIVHNVDAAQLYADHCASCHGDHVGGSTSTRTGRTAAEITAAIASNPQMATVNFLTQEEIQALADFLNVPPPPF